MHRENITCGQTSSFTGPGKADGGSEAGRMDGRKQENLMYFGTNAVMLGCKHVGFHPVGGTGTIHAQKLQHNQWRRHMWTFVQWRVGTYRQKSWCWVGAGEEWELVFSPPEIRGKLSVTFIPMLPSRTLAKHPNSHFSADQSRTNFCRYEPATGHFKSYSRWFLKGASALKGTEVLSPQKHAFSAQTQLMFKQQPHFCWLQIVRPPMETGTNIRWRLCRCCRLQLNYSPQEITGLFEGSQTSCWFLLISSVTYSVWTRAKTSSSTSVPHVHP